MENQLQNLAEGHFESKLSQNSLVSLRKTAPWMKFISIAGFIMTGVIILFAFIMLIFSDRIYPDLPGNLAGIALFVFYLIIGAISLWVYINLYNYSKYLQRFCTSGQEMHADKAFDWQKRFWVIIGIMLIIYLGIMALALVIGLFAGLMSIFS